MSKEFKAATALTETKTHVSEGSLVEESQWTIPKRDWGPGPWHEEPEEHQFEHRGIMCKLGRNMNGAWCGYVPLPEGHPWVGRKGENIPATCHGGITFSKQVDSEYFGITNAWVVGFDCSHGGDHGPAHEAVMMKVLGRKSILGDLFHSEYRNIDYATEETMKLADQTVWAMVDPQAYDEQ